MCVNAPVDVNVEFVVNDPAVNVNVDVELKVEFAVTAPAVIVVDALVEYAPDNVNGYVKLPPSLNTTAPLRVLPASAIVDVPLYPAVKVIDPDAVTVAVEASVKFPIIVNIPVAVVFHVQVAPVKSRLLMVPVPVPELKAMLPPVVLVTYTLLGLYILPPINVTAPPEI